MRAFTYFQAKGYGLGENARLVGMLFCRVWGLGPRVFDHVAAGFLKNSDHLSKVFGVLAQLFLSTLLPVLWLTLLLCSCCACCYHVVLPLLFSPLLIGSVLLSLWSFLFLFLSLSPSALLLIVVCCSFCCPFLFAACCYVVTTATGRRTICPIVGVVPNPRFGGSPTT